MAVPFLGKGDVMNDNGNIIKLAEHRDYNDSDILNAMQDAAGYIILTVSLDGMVSAYTTLERMCDVQRVLDAGEECLVSVLE